jgi:hypothetical protein
MSLPVVARQLYCAIRSGKHLNLQAASTFPRRIATGDNSDWHPVDERGKLRDEIATLPMSKKETKI